MSNRTFLDGYRNNISVTFIQTCDSVLSVTIRFKISPVFTTGTHLSLGILESKGVPLTFRIHVLTNITN